MSRTLKALAVYCGSATPADPVYIETAKTVGRTLAERGIRVVYGGGRLGLMGAVADAALAAGGEVIGVIPEALVGSEVAHRGCTELRVLRLGPAERHPGLTKAVIDELRAANPMLSITGGPRAAVKRRR